MKASDKKLSKTQIKPTGNKPPSNTREIDLSSLPNGPFKYAIERVMDETNQQPLNFSIYNG
jgi:hypothetical protein